MENVLVVLKTVFESEIKLVESKLYDDINKTFINMVEESYTYIPRNIAEYDTNYKQIIPYAFLTYKDFVFVLKRLPKQNESRLHNKYSLGIGGHINPLDDKRHKSIVEAGLFREMNEEISLKSNDINSTSFIGVLNDDTNDVGKVHLGFVYHIILEKEEIEILEKDKMEGEWVHKSRLKDYYNLMESWSQIVIDNLFRS